MVFMKSGLLFVESSMSSDSADLEVIYYLSHTDALERR